MFFYGFGGVPQSIPVCVLRRGMGRQNDFGVDDFAFMGIVFLFLVVFGKHNGIAVLCKPRRRGIAGLMILERHRTDGPLPFPFQIIVHVPLLPIKFFSL